MKTKKEILDSLACSREERMLLAGILDKEQASQRQGYLTHSKFLSMGGHAMCSEALRLAGAASHSLFWGGFDGAERGIYLFYPDYMDEENSKAAAPLALLRAQKRKEDRLSHRDYLGSLMGLQIDRSVVGDILVHEKGADIIVLEEASDFIQLNFTHAGRAPLSVSREPLKDLIKTSSVEKSGSGSVASPRLDCVAALIFSLGRKETQEKISGGLVFVNNMPCQKPERTISEGDRITIRGYGRAKIEVFGGLSRKGRLFVQFVKTI